MTKLFAQPYTSDAAGFYFDSMESYEEGAEGVKDRSGQAVEEFQISFSDGESIDGDLFEALGIHQGTIGAYFDAVDEWSDPEKIRVIIAVGECAYSFTEDTRPDDFDVVIYEMDSLKELAKRFVEEGLFGDIPENSRFYLNMDAIARDLGMDYSETEIAGRHYIYRCR